MKKLLLITAFVLWSMFSYTQNYGTLHVVNIEWNEIYSYCTNIDGVIVYGVDGCSQNCFQINNPPNIWCDSIIVTNEYADPDGYVFIDFFGCGHDVSFVIEFTSSSGISNPFPEPLVWKRMGDTIQLFAPGDNVAWSTGSHDNTIFVIDPEVYSVTITDACGSETFSVEVRDNQELSSVGVNLSNGLNECNWNPTDQQAEYFQYVRAYRNHTTPLWTVPYTDGVFRDTIGSDQTQWRYDIVGITYDGQECPIRSRWKSTIHSYIGSDNYGNSILVWTPYEEEGPDGEIYRNVVEGYGIYDVVEATPRLIIELGYFTYDYIYDPSNFDGRGAVGAMFAAKDNDRVSFSNLTDEVLLCDENKKTFEIYPNPAKNNFNITGTEKGSRILMYDGLGRQVLSQNTDDNVTHIEVNLSPGEYFIKIRNPNMDAVCTKKIVIQ